MNLANKKEIVEILKKYGIRLTKGLGQNFLINRNIILKLIRLSGINKSDAVLEIGPGIGVLTQELAKNSDFVIAVEKDRVLSEICKENLKDFNNVIVFNEDILKIDLKKIFSDLSIESYKLVANLPYNISLRIIREFLEYESPPKDMIVIIQKEVAQKICDKKSSLPRIAFDFYGKSKILFYLSKELFWPKPKVDGAVLHIADIQKNLPDVDRELFFKILKFGFSHPRKTIVNNLSGLGDKDKIIDWIEKSNIDIKVRPEDIKMEEWINLTLNFKL
ncbi:MAG: 16S rRNA (adenine(1518)-N(6)/adenine(1519)-N(6))-dimethyltransferase RsmA [Candidatus Pacebacteria bacterium]|nr:16S rRNA (adenine(1518)-N(6)/adenine(1519)-N(6))-dimethyltransferase RsmA [Candidatus Paceibacterota bacterium]